MLHGMIQQAADVADIASIIIASILFAGLIACVVMMVWLEAHVPGRKRHGIATKPNTPAPRRP